MREKTFHKLKELYELLSKVSISKRPSIIININNNLLFCYKERLSLSTGIYGKNQLLREQKPNRGDILSFFGVIELLINQILIKNFIQEERATIGMFEQLIDTVDLFTKIKLLNKWSIIDSETKERLIVLKEVRNSFAHSWDIESVKYKNKSIFENYHKFEEDADTVFNALTKIFNGGNIDIDKLIEEIRLKVKQALRKTRD